MIWLLPDAESLLLPPIASWVLLPVLVRLCPGGSPASRFLLAWIFGATGDIVGGLATGDLGSAACAFASLAVAVVIWRWRRRKRKRALRELGDKSRRRLAAIVSALRERAKPRPGLQPVPQGVR